MTSALTVLQLLDTLMVVVHRAHGLRFVIYLSDHEPAHVHLIGGGEAKVDLVGPDGNPKLVWVVGISRADLRRLLVEIGERQAEFLAAWRRLHG
jgi:hypothetical protein